MMKQLMAGVLLTTLTSISYALQSFEGKVTIVQPTYMPGVVSFTMDGDVLHRRIHASD